MKPCSCALVASKVQRRRWLTRVDLAPILEGVRQRLCSRDVCFGAIAHDVGLSEAHLRRAFRATYGQSPQEYSRQFRLDRAAEQLRSSHSQLGAIAHEAGYESQSSFCRAFRARFGCTPGEFRRTEAQP